MRTSALALIVALQVFALGPVLGAAPVPVRIGIANADNAAEPLYADEMGFFAKAGLQAQIALGMSGDDILKGLQDGSVDLGFVNTVSIAGALQRGDQLVVLAPGALYTSVAPVTVLVQSATANFRTAADLNTKTISTPGVNDLGQLGIEAWMDQNGGDSKSVRFVHGLSTSKLLSDLGGRQVDAGEVNEPNWTVARKAGAIKLLANSFDAIAPTFLIGAYVATKTWVTRNPGAARGFTAAMRETARWGNTHHAESAALIAKRFNVDPAVASSMIRATYAESLTSAILQPVLDAAAKYGLIKPMKASELTR